MSLFLVLLDVVFFAVGGFTVGFAMSGVVAFTVTAVTVLLVESLGFCPLVAFAGGRNEELPGGSGGEKRGQFHPGAGVADQPPMASGESFSVLGVRANRAVHASLGRQAQVMDPSDLWRAKGPSHRAVRRVKQRLGAVRMDRAVGPCWVGGSIPRPAA